MKLEIENNLLDLNTDVELQAQIYDISFDLSQAIELSKSSVRKSLSYKTKNGEELGAWEILDIIYSKARTIALLILPDEKCALIGEKKVNIHWRYPSTSPNQMFGQFKKGNYLITQKEKNLYSIETLALETNDGKVLQLMQYIEKLFKNWNDKIDFSNLGETVSLSLLKEKEREDTLKVILTSFKEQLEMLEKARKLEEVKFEYPSPNIIKVKLDTEGHLFTFEHSLSLNPSLVSQPLPSETEDAHFWLEALHVERDWNNNYAKNLKLQKIEEGIRYLMKHKDKDWFKFGVDKKEIKIERKISPSGVRFYLDGILTKQEEIVILLMSLEEKSKAQVLKEIEELHKIPEEIKELLTKGIIGQAMDLEGEVRFNIKVKRDGNRFSFLVDGKEFKVKGGFIAIKKFENAVKGSARYTNTWQKLGVHSSRDYRYILYLLEELLGKNESIEFYKLLKGVSRIQDVLSSKKLIDFLDAHKDVITSTKDEDDNSVFQIKIGENLFFVETEEPESAFELRGTKRFYIQNLEKEAEKRLEERLISIMERIIKGEIEVSSFGI